MGGDTTSGSAILVIILVLQGYTGPRCEVNVNECDTNPCLNLGTCLDGQGQFTCICMPGKY